MMPKLTRRMRVLRPAFLFLILLFPAMPEEYSAAVDWVTGKIEVIISVSPGEAGLSLPVLRSRAEMDADSYLKEALTRTVYSFYYDSSNTVKDVILQNPELYMRFDEFALGRTKTATSMAKDFSRFEARYTVSFYPGLIVLFDLRDLGQPLAKNLDFSPSARFTGIVIYAQEPVPVHGEEAADHVRPAILPRIFDTSMRLVGAPGNSEESSLEKWGFAGYGDSVDESGYIDRIGIYPFRTVAYGVFGKYRTDPIISTQAADIILASENNRSLLSQGKIVIILDPAYTYNR